MSIENSKTFKQLHWEINQECDRAIARLERKPIMIKKYELHILNKGLSDLGKACGLAGNAMKIFGGLHLNDSKQ